MLHVHRRLALTPTCRLAYHRSERLVFHFFEVWPAYTMNYSQQTMFCKQGLTGARYSIPDSESDGSYGR